MSPRVHRAIVAVATMMATFLVILDVTIANVALDPARQALIAGLLHFSQALGTTLVAEGIETGAERLALEDLGLTAGQGYLFGRPDSADSWRLTANQRRP